MNISIISRSLEVMRKNSFSDSSPSFVRQRSESDIHPKQMRSALKKDRSNQNLSLQVRFNLPTDLGERPATTPFRLSSSQNFSILCGALTSAQRKILINSMKRLKLDQGDVLFRQGDRGNTIYFIGRGACLVKRNHLESARLNQGDYFGEVAALAYLEDKQQPSGISSAAPERIADVIVATEGCIIYELSGDDFCTIFGDNQDALCLLRQVANERLTESPGSRMHRTSI
eukprot:766474-Hanusia_phi.AAC.1